MKPDFSYALAQASTSAAGVKVVHHAPALHSFVSFVSGCCNTITVLLEGFEAQPLVTAIIKTDSEMIDTSFMKSSLMDIA